MIVLLLTAGLLCAQEPRLPELDWVDEDYNSFHIQLSKDVSDNLLLEKGNYTIEAQDSDGKVVFSAAPAKIAKVDSREVYITLPPGVDVADWDHVQVRFSDSFAKAAGTSGTAVMNVGWSEPGFTLFKLGPVRPRLNVDLRSAEEKDKLGIDYDFQFLRIQAFSWGSGPTDHINLVGTSKGYIKLGQYLDRADTDDEEEEENLNAILSDISLDYFILWGLNADSATLGTFFKLKAYAGHESTQDFELTQYKVGLGLATTLGFITPRSISSLNFLDLRERRLPISAPRVFAGFESLHNPDDDVREGRTEDESENFKRATVELAWGIPILVDTSSLTVLWRGFYDLDAEKNRFDQFLEVEAALDFTRWLGSRDKKEEGESTDSPSQSGRYRFVLKYIGGRLPPSFADEHQVSAGFSLDF
jgi:hypothetical protein